MKPLLAAWQGHLFLIPKSWNISAVLAQACSSHTNIKLRVSLLYLVFHGQQIMTTKAQERAVFSFTCPGYSPSLWWNYPLSRNRWIISLSVWRYRIEHQEEHLSFSQIHNASYKVHKTFLIAEVSIMMYHLASLLPKQQTDPYSCIPTHISTLGEQHETTSHSGFYEVLNSSRPKLFKLFGSKIVHLPVEPISLSWPELRLLKMSPN